MSQNLPPGLPPQQHAYPPVKRTNGVAIASLVCGLLGCVPLITSLAAILLGILGMKKTKDPTVGGKGFAIAGLVLGIVGIAGWTLSGGAIYLGYSASKPARAVANQFAVDLSTGNTAAALAASAGMTTQQLDSVIQQIQPWGTVNSTTFTSFNIATTASTGTTCDLTGIAVFTNGGTKAYTVRLIKQGEAYKVQSFNFK